MGSNLVQESYLLQSSVYLFFFFLLSELCSIMKQVPVSVLEGKIVALYFFYSAYSSCAEFTPTLVQVYEKLKEKGENFEVVLVPLDEEEASFVESFAAMPWLALPFKDKSCERLAGHFELNKIPYLATIGADGKTMDVDFADIIEEHGFLEAVEAFPFHQHKLNLLAENAKKKMEAQTLGSLLVSGDLDYVIAKEGAKVKDLCMIFCIDLLDHSVS